jgi:hypothetical protein
MSRLTKMLTDAGDVRSPHDDPAEICANIQAGALVRALLLAAMATALWYVLWFGLSLNLPAWAGLLIFVGAFLAGYGFARRMLLQSLAEEIQRRRDLKIVAENWKQRQSTK